MRISPLTSAFTPPTAPRAAVAAPAEPRDTTSVLGRAARGLHVGTVAALGWTVGSVVGLAGFVGNLAPGAWLGLRRAMGDSAYSEFATRSDRSDRWVLAKVVQTALVGTAAALVLGVNPVAGAVVGAIARAPLGLLASRRHLDYEMNMAVEAAVPRGNVLTGAARGAVAAAVTGWRSGLNNVRALVSAVAGTAEQRERGSDLLYWDFGREMSPEGRADACRARLLEPGHGPSERTRLLDEALKHTGRIYESQNTFLSREDQHRITVRSWADGLRSAPSAAWATHLPKATNEELLRLHGTLTERLDADRAYPAFERFLRRHDHDFERAMRDFQEAVPRMLAGESVDEATLDRDTRGLLGVERPTDRPEVVRDEEQVQVGGITLPVRK